MDDVILNKAMSIERCIQRIKTEYYGFEDELESNFTKQDSIVLNLQRACENAIDMAAHVVRIEKLGVPLASREVFELLANHQIISLELKDALQKMVGFRNIAVHNYIALELSVIQKVIAFHLTDLEKFNQILIEKYV